MPAFIANEDNRPFNPRVWFRETWRMLDGERLRAELALACEDASLAPAAFVVYVVDERRPPWTTPVAYLQPAGSVWPDTVAVFRAAGVERVARHHLAAHRLAIWNELPGIPEVALGPMLRHELEHARRWERSGTSFFEADDLLRAAVRRAGGSGYLALPSEREANTASAAYAAKALSPAEIEQLRAWLTALRCSPATSRRSTSSRRRSPGSRPGTTGASA